MNSQISTNAIRNNKAVKAIYAKEQEQEAVCVWGVNLNIVPFTYTKSETSITITGLKNGVNMQHLRVPETIEELPVTGVTYGAFENNTVLKSIKLPNSLNSIDSYAFSGCSGLTSITIPDSVTSIKGRSFGNCTGLTSVTIGNGIKFIEGQAFYGCDNLQYIYITDIAVWCGIDGLGGLMEYGSKNKKLYINNELATSITIPDSVTTIPSYAFYRCTGLTNITISDSVTKIGSYAFYICTGITSVTIPDSVTSIGSYAFYNCTGLTSITFNGTEAQWEAITKGSSWDYNIGKGNYTIHCTDGDIPKQ